MGKYSKYTFDNPYLEEGDENKYTASLVMDEARERWRVGNWRASHESFDIKRDKLSGKKSRKNAPSAARFHLDVKKDLMGEAISVNKLRELNYSPAYRPKGNLDEHLVTPMSTMQRYDVLAGDLEAPPEDISFLSDADKRLKMEAKKGAGKKDGSLRYDSCRLPESLDERRSRLMEMLPGSEEQDAKRIVRDSKRKKARLDAELGKQPTVEPPKKPARGVRIPEPPEESGYNTDTGSYAYSRDRLRRQNGLVGASAKLPEFESETRRWSNIASENPSWSEVMSHTENYTPADMEPNEESVKAHYIEDVDYDPENPFRQLKGAEPRNRLRSDEAGKFQNEYIPKEGIDPERIREIMRRKYRGRWIPPEYYADNRLVSDWFNDFSKGAIEGEDFLDWAYRRRSMEMEMLRRQEAQHRAMVEALRRPASGRRGSYYGGGGSPRPVDRYEEERRRCEEARRRGYENGAEIARETMRDNRGLPPGRYPVARDPRAAGRGRDYYDDRRPRERGGYDDRADRRGRGDGGKPRYRGAYPELFERSEDDFD